MGNSILAIKNIAKEETAKMIIENISNIYEGTETLDKEDFYNAITEFIEKNYLFLSDNT